MRRRPAATRVGGSLAEAVLTASAPRLLRAAGIAAPPYDPWKVAEYLRIPVSEQEMSAAGVDGYVEYVDEWPKIVLNREAPQNRRRFTLGHELGHALLMLRVKRDDGIKLGLKRYANGTIPAAGSASDPLEERLCDRFAAELLMPRTDLSEYWRGRAMTAQAVRECAALFAVSLFTACARTVQILRGSNASYWQRRPWAMTEWERGASISPREWQLLAQFVETIFDTRRQPHAITRSFVELDLHADAAVCGRECLLLVVSRGPREHPAAESTAERPPAPSQARLPGL